MSIGWNLPLGVTSGMIDDAAGDKEEAFFAELEKEEGPEDARTISTLYSSLPSEVTDALDRSFLKAHEMGTKEGFDVCRENEAEYWACAPLSELLRHLKKVRPEVAWPTPEDSIDS